MKKATTFITALILIAEVAAQTNPAITKWLLNTNGAKGRHYAKGNSTAVQDNDSVNVQTGHIYAPRAFRPMLQGLFWMETLRWLPIRMPFLSFR
jgi:hypothetical protein